jgi:outer membrane protein assembly factor BamB
VVSSYADGGWGGRFRLPRFPLLLLSFCASAQVLTSQYDNARTGATLAEKFLTPANVNPRQFGKQFTLPVDGDVYAQPLFVPGVPVPGKGTHDIVFVATEHDSVYAFDAAGQPAAPLWKVSFLNEGAGVTTVPAGDAQCPLIRPEIGITPTPVIDLATGTLYVLARTRERQGMLKGARYVQKLHALAITTGAEKFGGPVEIAAEGFDGLRQLSRAAMLLVNGSVVMSWGSSCDVKPYTGWVMAYEAATLKQRAVFNAAPDAGESGIWQSDMGPAADQDGNIYVATGNGRFTAAAKGRDYGDTLLKLGPDLKVRDYFTPSNERKLNAEDDDLGSGGPVLLPGVPRLVLIAGKEGVLYAIDRDRMGKFQAPEEASAIQTIKLRGGIYAAPAYWNGHVYALASGDYLTDFRLENGRLSKPLKLGVQRFHNSGASPVVSSNGTRDAVIWLIESKTWNGADQPAILHAYDAADVSREIYSSETNTRRDQPGNTLRFTIPTVANGRVYINAKRMICVYGLLQ